MSEEDTQILLNVLTKVTDIMFNDIFAAEDKDDSEDAPSENSDGIVADPPGTPVGKPPNKIYCFRCGAGYDTPHHPKKCKFCKTVMMASPTVEIMQTLLHLNRIRERVGAWELAVCVLQTLCLSLYPCVPDEAGRMVRPS